MERYVGRYKRKITIIHIAKRDAVYFHTCPAYCLSIISKKNEKRTVRRTVRVGRLSRRIMIKGKSYTRALCEAFATSPLGQLCLTFGVGFTLIFVLGSIIYTTVSFINFLESINENLIDAGYLFRVGDETVSKTFDGYLWVLIELTAVVWTVMIGMLASRSYIHMNRSMQQVWIHVCS